VNSLKKEELEHKTYENELFDEPVGIHMPSVNEPKLWMVWVKPNHEREVAASIMLKYFDLKGTDNTLMISSVIVSSKLVGNI